MVHVSKIFFACLLALIPFGLSAQNTSINLSVDRTNITIEDNIQMELELVNVGRFPDFTPELDKFAVISGPIQSSSFRWVNGQSFSSKKLIYVLTPLETGKLQLGPFNMQYENRNYSTETITITVADAPAAQPRAQRQQPGSRGAPPQDFDPLSDDRPVFLEAVPDKRTLYVGEQVTVFYKLFTRVPVTNYTLEKLPEAVGFWQEQINSPRNPQLKQEIINGVRFNTAIIHEMAYFPTKSGELRIEPLPIVVEIQSSRRRSLFDDFFSDPFGQSVNRQIASNVITLDVQATPAEGKPAAFNGAVGEYTVTTTIDTPVVKMNEAVGMNIAIAGKGNVPLVSLPDFEIPDGLDMFEPEVEKSNEIVSGELVGEVEYNYVFIPRKEGTVQLPQIPFSYFNPETKRYQTLNAGGKYVQVLPVDQPAVVTGSGFSREEVRLLNADIRYLKPQLGQLRNLDSIYYNNAWFYAMALLSIAIFGGSIGYRYWYENWGQDMAYIRRRNARRIAADHIKNAQKSDDPIEQFSLLAKSILGFIGNKLNMAENTLKVSDIKQILAEKGVPADTITAVEQFLSACDEGRFSPESQQQAQVEILTSNAKTLNAELNDYL